MALNLTKLCNKQSLCAKCSCYFPNDSIMYWSGRNHTICFDCMRSEIAEQNDIQKRIPICVSDGCSLPLSLERMNRVPGVKQHGYCYGCIHYVHANQLMEWPSCRHSICKHCALGRISTNINSEQIPLCPADGCC